MERFVRGDDRSLALAGEIEVALDDHYGEREPFADLCLSLASYRPGGGPYLYDEDSIVPMMKRVIEEMRRRGDCGK
jgi:hypothetical protein